MMLQTMMVAALLVSGMGVALLGSVKVALAHKLGIDETRVGGLVSLFGFTLIPVILTAGFLTDLVGRQVVMVSGSVLFALSLAVLAAARSYLAALAAVVMLSGGWALMINVGNVLTPVAFQPAGDSQGEGTAFATNLANVFFGLGAFLTPMAVVSFVHRLGLGRTLRLLGGVTLVPGILALAVNFGAIQPGTATGAAQGGALLTDPVMWLCGLALFFYGPLEASMAAWTTTYLRDRGSTETRAARLLSGFWLAYVASRLVSAFVLLRVSETSYLLSASILGILVLAHLVWSPTRKLDALAVLAAGFVFGPIFPTLMAVLLGHFPAAVHGRAVGMLFAIGGVGWALIPIFIGAHARSHGVQRAFAIAVAAAVGLSGAAVGLLLTK